MTDITSEQEALTQAIASVPIDDVRSMTSERLAAAYLAALPEGWALRRLPGQYGNDIIVDIPESASWVEVEFPDEAAYLRQAGATAERERLAPFMRLHHLTTCKSYGVGLGGGSRAGYPCTCGLAQALADPEAMT